MERLSSATDGSFGRFLITLIFLALPAAAQVRGVAGLGNLIRFWRTAQSHSRSTRERHLAGP